jgi:hypothetical protein
MLKHDFCRVLFNAILPGVRPGLQSAFKVGLSAFAKELVARFRQFVPGDNPVKLWLSCPSPPFLVKELGYNEQAFMGVAQ